MSDPYGYDGSSVNPDAFVTNRSDSTQETKPKSSRCKHCGLVRQDRIHGLPGEFGAHEFEPVPSAPPSSSSGEPPNGMKLLERQCIVCLQKHNCWTIDEAARPSGDGQPAAQPDCPHDRLNEDGICRSCGGDCRGIGGPVPASQPVEGQQAQGAIGDDLKSLLNRLLDEHPCSYGGFEGGEIVAQPCDRCDSIRQMLSRLAAHPPAEPSAPSDKDFKMWGIRLAVAALPGSLNTKEQSLESGKWVERQLREFWKRFAPPSGKGDKG